MGSIIEDLYDHEGYGVRRLPEATLSATGTAESAAFDSYVAACACGWRGGDHPPTEEGYDTAVDEWEHDHARLLLAETVPAHVLAAINDAEQASGRLARQRPAAALKTLDELGAWVGMAHPRLGVPEDVANRMRHRLNGLGERDRRPPRL